MWFLWTLKHWYFWKHSIQLIHSVMSGSLQPHGLQHTRLPCPSPTPGTCSDSYPLSQWRHPTISSSVVPFLCIQSFLASESFLRSQFFASGSQSIETSALASIPSNEYSGLFSFRIDWFDLFTIQETLGWPNLIVNTHYEITHYLTVSPFSSQFYLEILNQLFKWAKNLNELNFILAGDVRLVYNCEKCVSDLCAHLPQLFLELIASCVDFSIL